MHLPALPALFVSAALLLSSTAHAANSPDKDREQIKEVVESFRIAIIKKDKPAFSKLFYPGPVAWVGAFEDNSLQALRNKNPQAKRSFADTWEGFIDYVVKDETPLEEKFNNVRIDTDGIIGNVNFDYSFHHGNTKSNWGREFWHLTKTDEGWKINSVIFSMTLPPQDRAK